MHNFRKLDVWKKAVELATKIYEATEKYSKEEIYGLTSQIRRCTISISSNIAEGSGRNSKKDFQRFLDIATGSCYELETQLMISRNLKYLTNNVFKKLLNSLSEIQKMIYSLNKSMDNK